ncbi:DNA alkylation repair protein [Flavilitoribacter nigricans]|uniref:DNA alkylation repair protein n=1 Tax=Flavilitoribacter nigricans (strain ATCC 23147 / DSM 23189 / NBRC 102662 / NCIMB 1420 / SS-2) TaxID=1122177 RepID=A0A2D0NIA4_FLAN2|nr:DNA alkylation repair protein [Flavilitoribacter nigricans]PHN08120.1 DNA alkylation repair protein [Flavilitoribacter nigricans DSM 23189 = NBRC 102662]
MRKITRKGEILAALEKVCAAYREQGPAEAVACCETEMLQHKVKFPLLETFTRGLYECLPETEQLAFCDRIAALRTIGGNVLLGIMLQERLTAHFLPSFGKAAEYIAAGEQWYVCDIIGERVFGYALLHQPERTLPELERLARHPSFWVVRSLGAGSHYAIKKGLEKTAVRRVFALLLSLCNTRNKEVRQGVGWAAKTTARFHPDIIAENRLRIQNEDQVPGWFRTKIKIGLARHQHAQGDNG